MMGDGRWMMMIDDGGDDYKFMMDDDGQKSRKQQRNQKLSGSLQGGWLGEASQTPETSKIYMFKTSIFKFH